jgi:hypothetical protein
MTKNTTGVDDTLRTTGLDAASMDEWTRASKIVSDGGSSQYYTLPLWAQELDDLIVAKKMPWHIANIFKACYRWDEKEGNTIEYEANKIQWFATQLNKHVKEGRYGK